MYMSIANATSDNSQLQAREALLRNNMPILMRTDHALETRCLMVPFCVILVLHL